LICDDINVDYHNEGSKAKKNSVVATCNVKHVVNNAKEFKISGVQQLIIFLSIIYDLAYLLHLPYEMAYQTMIFSTL
jgi:hypothetical protein